MTWMTDVGPKGKPSGTPIPPLFIMAEPARPLLSQRCRTQRERRARRRRGARGACQSVLARGRSSSGLDCSLEEFLGGQFGPCRPGLPGEQASERAPAPRRPASGGRAPSWAARRRPSPLAS